MRTIQASMLLLMLAGFLPALAQDAAAGKQAYATCIACHGVNGEGNKTLNSPAIAGQEEWYIIQQLNNFKQGIRGADSKDVYGMQMRPMAMTLTTDKMVADVAAYVSAMKPIDPKPTLDGDASKGKSLYVTCIACHGPEGKGMKPLHSPNLTLQQDWYLLRQLQHFKNGIRGTNPKDQWGMTMRPMSMTLANDQAMKDVIAYIMTLGD